MMSLKDRDFQLSYDSSEDDLVQDFYIPALSEAIKYCRIAGYFTSSSFAVSAIGIYELIKNHGCYKLIMSPALSDKDVEMIRRNIHNEQDVIISSMSAEVLLDTEEVIKNHHEVLAWMLKEGYLIIKVVMPRDANGQILSKTEIDRSGIFHQKVGIFEDVQGNILSFSGSINETFSAWTKNIEEFKTFRSWDDKQKPYCLADVKKFYDIWEGKKNQLDVIDIPEAVKKKIVSKAPSNIDFVCKKLAKKVAQKKDNLSLFYFQKEAHDEWLANNRQMIFQMATGTGKTRTAIACIKTSVDNASKKAVIISTPQSTLSDQWKKEIDKLYNGFDKEVFADGRNTRWRKDLKRRLLELAVGNIQSLVVYSTHDTSSKMDFIQIVEDEKFKNIDYVFVADEVHALGSQKRRRGFSGVYSERIGLSATPLRWFDTEGTEIILNYFKQNKYEFGIDRALNEINPLTDKTFLAAYYYNVYFVELTEEESDEYDQLTKEISRIYHISNNQKNKNNEMLDKITIERAKILKNAENKYECFEKIIKSIRPNISKTLIFVSPQQIKKVSEILTKHDVHYAHYTQKQDAKSKEKAYGHKTERQHIIDMFAQEEIEVIVAISCLNEGIDIPCADKAILMSSTTNPREYIQRIGRVIRQHENKKEARIYDLMVSTPFSTKSEIDDKIFDKEYQRVKYIAQYAKNNAEALKLIRRGRKHGN